MPNTSICEDVKSNDVGLYKAIKKNKLKTFTSMLATEKFAVKDKEVLVRANRDLFARLLVIREKREVSMKDFLKYSLRPLTWSLATSLGKENQSGQSNTSWCSKSVWRHVYDNECMTSSTNYQQVSIRWEIYLIMSSRGLHPIAQLTFFSSLISNGKCQLSLASAKSGAERGP